ncbi:zinc finger protein 569-like isoform X2 [Nylanderia fulva]|uniref:zinc finger protein 569-like isoform X2 n=1 Tax=Nylanderia fulva TaxID=613905 RepID=UPI0010FB43F0|nr:zinc finger protein 569-like isoform X2 [Nylanderia fulva]
MCSLMNPTLFGMDDAMDKLENACRLCLEQRNEMLPIFGDEGLQRRVVQKLRACLPVLVYKTDPLPKQICQFCAARLDDVYEFREYCLNVYKSMYAMLNKCTRTDSVQIFLDAMKNSADPCQAQLCKEKSRAPPPLVPLSIAMPFDDSVTPLNQISQDHLQNACMETLPELPCEVEIKEMNADPILDAETTICEPSKKKRKLSDIFDANMQMGTNVSIFEDMEDTLFKADYQTRKEEKRTSILEQVLTGSLTMNNHQQLQPRVKLTSEWWCAPCNSYYKTKDSLMKHMHLHCPRVYTCRKCSLSFNSVEVLAKHEANNHLKVKLDYTENLQDCHKCDRQFISYEMLRQHRLRDHLAELTEIGTNTWCSLCNRFFPTVKSYQNHILLHTHNQANSIIQQKLPVVEPAKIAERPKEIKREEQFYENVKSLMCPTCGKVCTQQSALSNHMRTHEPKRHKCDICGRSFGLFIRLAAHRVTEHNVQPTMLPVLSPVEQEEALNAEREAREAREAKTRGTKNRFYSEVMEKNNVLLDDESSTKRNSSGFKNVARCGICLLWFSDHTTMLTHLQTHSDNSHKNFVCHICKKSFKEQSQLLRHESCHKRLTLDNASLYTSATCNKSSSMDKTQQKMHTVDRTYHCAKCNKIFFKEVSLLTHQCTSKAQIGKKTAAKSQQKTSSHDTDKKYKCSKCDASFASSQSRNAHMRMHVEGTHSSTAQKHEIKVEKDEPMPKLRPETSLEYNMSLIEPKIEISEQSTPPPLKRTLIKTANGHRCGVCQSPFVSRELAVAHLRSAHPVMPYQCPYCKKRFTTQYTFTHHIKTEHPDEPEK